MGKIIPLVIALVGLGAGVGAGIALRPGDAMPEPEMTEASPCGEVELATAEKPKPDANDKEQAVSDFVKMSNQFVFPLVQGSNVAALVVLSLTLEIAQGQSEAVFVREPKLRDGFLRVLLDHANAGGFDGAFTSNATMDKLRRALVEKGREVLDDALYDVLILDINRQDT